MNGIVTKSTGSWYTVRNAEGKRFQCRIAGKIRLENRRTTNPIAVGDHVHFDEEADGNGIIKKIDPRKIILFAKALIFLNKRIYLQVILIRQF